MSVGQRLTVAAFRAAWRLACRVPEPVAYRGFDAIAEVTYRRGGSDVRRMRANYARVRPEVAADPAALEALVREGLRSYLRYWCEAFRLPARPAEVVVAGVRAVGDEPVRAVLDAGRPVVCFLGHMGNWDSAAVWAARRLAPVLTVAERLEPEELYREFLSFREGLGMTILPLTGEGDVFGRLVRHARQHRDRGVVVPLLADRDLTHTGVEVDFFGRPARMAAGPAALALALDAPLHPVSMHYERAREGPGGHRLVITFHPRVEPPPPTGAGREGSRARVATMTQACADALAGAIAEHTADWHMMQRVFAEDLTPRTRRPGPDASMAAPAPARGR